MFMLAFLSVVISLLALAIFVAGFMAFLSNPKKPQNRWFFVFAVLLALWMVFNFYDSTFVSRFWTELALKLDFITALFIGWAFVFFVVNFNSTSTGPDVPSKRARFLMTATCLINLVFIPLSLANLLVTASIEKGSLEVVYGPVYNAYTVLLLIYFIYGLWRLFRKRLHAVSEQKAALSLIFMGLLIAIVANLLTNLVFPTLISTRATVQALNMFGYAGLLILTLSIYLAITRQKLFDIRLIVARSLAYIFSLLSLGVIFTFGAFSITNLFFNGNNIDVITLRWLYAFLAVVLAILFPPLKQFFDKVTNRLFFRDAYDTRVFLDEFNKNLAITRELDQLLKQSAKIIEQNIKPSYCVFVINGTKNTRARVTGSGNRAQMGGKYIDEVKVMINHTNQKLIVTDELSSKNGPLQKLLRQEDIVILSRLTPSLTTSRFDIGYLLMGPKKSGNLYSSQDSQVIEIISNELIIAVQNALRFEEIENFNITLQGRVDEATKKLRRANEKLRQLDETKDDFISMASHQLRTPLTSVKGYISMVLEGDGGKINHKQHEMLGQAFFSSQRMVYLIADLLNVSRLKTGKFVIDAAPVNLARVVKEELEQLEETADSHSIKLTYDKPKSFPDLMLDETKTRQVIMNFVDNAIYYTPGGGHINVHLIDHKETVELRIEDDGIGVPKTEQPHLFTKFYRAGNARKARPDGTGLGLFMAKKVVVAQGGSLIFESQEGKGSTFGFVFSKNKLSTEKHKQ